VLRLLMSTAARCSTARGPRMAHPDGRDLVRLPPPAIGQRVAGRPVGPAERTMSGWCCFFNQAVQVFWLPARSAPFISSSPLRDPAGTVKLWTGHMRSTSAEFPFRARRDLSEPRALLITAIFVRPSLGCSLPSPRSPTRRTARSFTPSHRGAAHRNGGTRSTARRVRVGYGRLARPKCASVVLSAA